MSVATGIINLSQYKKLNDSALHQYFWFESNSSATVGGGAHITIMPEGSFRTNANNWSTSGHKTDGGSNILLNTSGIQLRNGSLPMMSLTSTALNFYTISGDTSTSIAEFGASGATIGKSGSSQFILGANSLTAKGSTGTTYFSVSSTGITYGSNKTVATTDDVQTAQDAAQTYADGVGTAANTYTNNQVAGKADKTATVNSVETWTEYRLSNNSDSLTGSGTGYTWDSALPTWSSNKYIWTRVATKYTPITGSATIKYSPGAQGNEWGIYDSQLTTALSTSNSAYSYSTSAASGVKTTQEYKLSNSATQISGSYADWNSTVPTWQPGTYIWTRLKIETTSTTGTTTTTYTPNTSGNGVYDKALTESLISAEKSCYTVEIKVTNPDYVNNTATLTALVYYKGGSIPSEVSISYAWYQDSVSGSSIGSSNVLNVTNSMGLEHIYICVISSSSYQ